MKRNHEKTLEYPTKKKLKIEESTSLNSLPPELLTKITQPLSKPELTVLSITSKYYLNFFKLRFDIDTLLFHVVRSDYDAVQRILANNISLVFKRGKVTDCSERTFEQISAFEYALWALDKHMWALMLACIPPNEMNDVFETLCFQYKQVNTLGVQYVLNDKIICEPHFDFENIIVKELQTQVHSVFAIMDDAENNDDRWRPINEQWVKGVGGAQRLLPMHAIYQFCSTEPFSPRSRPESLRSFYHWDKEERTDWFSSSLGVDIAINKYDEPESTLTVGVQTSEDGISIEHLDSVLTTMKTLFQVRLDEFINLQSQLEERTITNSYFLLFHVVNGDYDAVQKILEEDINLLFAKNRITDCSKRFFAPISAFEYALWALDKHMWTLMLACIPQNEERNKRLAILHAQYEKVNKIGLTYELNETIITEHHFDFENILIKELQTQVDSVIAIKDEAENNDSRWDPINEQWRKGVGGAQRLLPMHAVYQFCSQEPFSLSSRPESSRLFYHAHKEGDTDWFSSGFGVDIAINRHEDRLAVGEDVSEGDASIQDLNSVLTMMKTLFQVRSEEFINLQSQFEEEQMIECTVKSIL